MATLRRITVNESGKVTIVTFNDSKIIDEAEIQEFGQELYDLVGYDDYAVLDRALARSDDDRNRARGTP